MQLPESRRWEEQMDSRIEDKNGYHCAISISGGSHGETAMVVDAKVLKTSKPDKLSAIIAVVIFH